MILPAKARPARAAPPLRLVASVEPSPDESFVSIVLRAAERSGVPSARWIRSLVEARGCLATGATDPNAEAAAALRIPATALLRCLYVSDQTLPSQQRRFMGSAVDVFFLSPGRKLCPACIAERGMLLPFWDLEIATACPEHGTYLLHTCPECSKPLSWDRPGIARCSCKYDLASAKTASAPSATIAMMILLMRAAEGNLKQDPSVLVAKQIAVLDLERLVRFVWLLGYPELIDELGPRATHRKIAGDTVRLVDAGAAVVLGWPSAFHSLLERRRATPPAGHSGGVSLAAAWRHFYSQLPRAFSGPQFEFLRREFAGHLRAKWDRCPIGSKHRRLWPLIKGTGSPLVRGNEAARALGIPRTIVRNLIKSGELHGAVTEVGRKRFVFVRRDSIKSYIAQTGGAVTLLEAVSILGLSERAVRALVHGGLLAPLHRPDGSNLRRWFFPRKQVEALVASCVGRFATTPNTAVTPHLMSKKSDGHIVTLAWALRHFADANIWLPQIIGRMAEGEFAVGVAAEHYGLGAVCVRKLDVARIVEAGRHASSGAMTIPQVARTYRLRQEVLYDLCHLAIIETVSNDLTGDLQITRTAWRAFVKRYVGAATLARQVGTSPRALVERLKDNGIEPATGPSVDGGIKYYYQRSDISTRETSPSKMHGRQPRPLKSRL